MERILMMSQYIVILLFVVILESYQVTAGLQDIWMAQYFPYKDLMLLYKWLLSYHATWKPVNFSCQEV